MKKHMTNLVKLIGFFSLAFQMACQGVQSQTSISALPFNSNQPKEVEVLVIQNDHPNKVVIPGEITTGETFLVKSTRTDYVIGIQSLTGTVLSKGSILAQLATEQLEHQITELKLNLNSAELQIRSSAQFVAECRRTLTQNEILFAEGLQNKNTVEKSRYELEQALVNEQKAHIDRDVVAIRIEHIKAELANSTIQAPFDCYLLRKLAQVGSKVSEGETLLEIAPALTLGVKFKISQGEEPNLKIGDQVDVQFTPECTLKNSVSATVKQVERFTDDPGSILCTALFSAPVSFQLGLVVDVAIKVNKDQNTVIPRVAVTSLMNDPSQNGIFVVVNNKVIFKPIQIKDQIGDMVHPSSELPPGDKIVIGPPSDLKPGDMVVILKEFSSFP
jgi:RND family efflux transporter MFP subunit